MKRLIGVLLLALLLVLIGVSGWRRGARKAAPMPTDATAAAVGDAALTLEEVRQLFPTAIAVALTDGGLCEVRDGEALLGYAMKSAP